jgi:hypothetical protein
VSSAIASSLMSSEAIIASSALSGITRPLLCGGRNGTSLCRGAGLVHMDMRRLAACYRDGR